MSKNKTKLLKIVATPLLAVCLLFLYFAGLASADPVITQGYNTTSSLTPGALVAISGNTNDSVVPANSANAKALVGVVVDNNNSQVSISSGSSQVQVATSGVNQILVTDMNGSIVAGDEITPSPINGVGMLASQNSEVIGTAQASFPNASASTQTVKTSSGSQRIKIGSIPLLVSVSYFSKQPNKTVIPASLQNLANAVAGKEVKTLPVILSAVIFILTLVAVVSIIFSLVHGSIISVGRNPMAQAAVYRNVLQLSALVVGIIAVAMFSIFMILTKVS